MLNEWICIYAPTLRKKPDKFIFFHFKCARHKKKEKATYNCDTLAQKSIWMPAHVLSSAFKKKITRQALYLLAFSAVCHIIRHTQRLMWFINRILLLMDYLSIVFWWDCSFYFFLHPFFFVCHLCLSDMSCAIKAGRQKRASVRGQEWEMMGIGKSNRIVYHNWFSHLFADIFLQNYRGCGEIMKQWNNNWKGFSRSPKLQQLSELKEELNEELNSIIWEN